MAGTVIPVIIFSGEALTGILVLVSLGAILEFTQLVDLQKKYQILSVIWGIFFWACVLLNIPAIPVAAIAFPLIGVMVLTDKEAVIIGLDIMTKWLMGFVYCIVPFVLAYCFIFDGEHPYDWRLPLGIVMINYTSDTFAYFVGKYLGKHAFSPTISPKKTWEGVIGGVLGAWLAGFAMYSLLGEARWSWLLLSLIISIFNQPGDLIESVIKRNVNKKDSGTFIPGHGGILDRVDSLLTIFPIIYCYQSFI